MFYKLNNRNKTAILEAIDWMKNNKIDNLSFQTFEDVWNSHNNTPYDFEYLELNTELRLLEEYTVMEINVKNRGKDIYKVVDDEFIYI